MGVFTSNTLREPAAQGRLSAPNETCGAAPTTRYRQINTKNGHPQQRGEAVVTAWELAILADAKPVENDPTARSREKIGGFRGEG